MFYYILFLLLFVIVLLYSLSFIICHCFLTFSLLFCLSFFDDVFFLFIFIIMLWYYPSFYIIYCFVTFSFFPCVSFLYYILFLYISSNFLWNFFNISQTPLCVAIEDHSIEIVQYLVENGADVNTELLLLLFISLITLWNLLSYHINLCFMVFYFFSYLSLFYYIFFLSMCIISLLHFISLYIFHCFMVFF